MKPLAEIRQSLIGEGVVIPLPGELGLDEALRGQGLHGFDDLEVPDGGDIGMSWAVEVFGGDEDAFFEEGFVYLERVSAGEVRKKGGYVRCGGFVWR